jgi:hypothetical protein
MTLRFFRTSLSIPSGAGRKTFGDTVDFPSNVIRADAALNGFKLDYTEGGDRHINEVEVDIDVGPIQGTSVGFTIETQYADVNFDDPYSGYVTVLVIADVQ